MNLRHLTFGVPLLVVTACGAPVSPQANRGSQSFQVQLARGAGAQLAAPQQLAAPMQLVSSLRDNIVELKIDPAAQTWGWASFDTERMPLIATQDELLSWSQQWIASKSQELGLAPSELVSFDRTRVDPVQGLSFVTFKRSFQNRPVQGAFVQLIFNSFEKGFKLREVLNNSYGEILITGDSEAPTPDEVAAATGLKDYELVEQQAVIQPLLLNGESYDFRLATAIAVQSQNSDGESFRFVMDNASHEFLEASSNHTEARHQVLLNTYTRTYVLKDEKPRPLASFSLQIAGNAALLEANDQGVIETDATAATLVLASSKSASGIFNVLTTPTVLYSFPVTLPAAGGTTTLNLTQADAASLNTFMAVHEINEYAKKFLDPTKVPLLTQGIAARVNVDDPSGAYCNAYFDGATINFLRAGATCANMALINEIIYHEWGHALDNVTGIVTAPTGISDGAFSEGLGDIIATYFIGNPNIGLGIALDRADLTFRTLENTRRYPPANAQESEVHSAGTIIGGAFWDLRKALVTRLGPVEGSNRAAKLLFQHMTMTDRYIDSYQSLLRLDDTDGNPATRSPLYCTITRAFAAHNLTGGALADETCVDPDTSIKVRVDVDNGNGSLSLVVAAAGASKIEACAGKVTTCTSDMSGYTVFTSDATSPSITSASGKLFYQASAFVTVTGGAPITIVSRNATGGLIGTRTMQFDVRDQKADLSQQTP